MVLRVLPQTNLALTFFELSLPLTFRMQAPFAERKVAGGIGGTAQSVLLSSRRIKCGEIISRELPLVSSPFSNIATRVAPFWGVCLGCCKVLFKQQKNCRRPTGTCDECEWPLCGPKCSKIQNHSTKECKIFSASAFSLVQAREMTEEVKLVPNIIYDAVRVVRCLLLKDSDPEAWKKLMTLESHVELRASREVNIKVSEFVVSFVNTAWPANGFSEADIDKIYEIVRFNSRAAGDGTGLYGKYGVYPHECDPFIAVLEARVSYMAAHLRHSCVPNCQVRRDGEWTSIQAVKNIPDNKILTCWMNFDKTFFLGVPTRMDYLQDHYFFKCYCPRCRSVDEQGSFTSAIKCREKMQKCEGYYLPCVDTMANVWKCNVCHSAKLYDQTLEIDVLKVGLELEEIRRELLRSRERGRDPEAASNTAAALKLVRLVGKHEGTRLHENHLLLLEAWLDAYPLILEELMPTRTLCTDGVYNLAKVLVGRIQITVELLDKLGVGRIYLRGMLRYFQTQALHKMSKSSRFEEESAEEPLQLFMKSMRYQNEAIQIFEEMCAREVLDSVQYKWLISRRVAVTRSFISFVREIVVPGPAHAQHEEHHRQRQVAALEGKMGNVHIKDDDDKPNRDREE